MAQRFLDLILSLTSQPEAEVRKPRGCDREANLRYPIVEAPRKRDRVIDVDLRDARLLPALFGCGPVLRRT